MRLGRCKCRCSLSDENHQRLVDEAGVIVTTSQGVEHLARSTGKTARTFVNFVYLVASPNGMALVFPNSELRGLAARNLILQCGVMILANITLHRG